MKSLSLICTGLALAFSLTAEDWPSFRGPTRQGLSAERNVPLTWSESSNLAWRTEIPGAGWSSPIVWDSRVFVTTVTENGTQCHVLCLDRDSGKILWDTRVFEQVPRRKEGKNSYATPTPVTDGKSVFAVFGDGSVAALDFTGKVLWTNREVEFYSRHGLGASPLLVDGLLVMPYDGSNASFKSRESGVGDDEKLGWQIPWDQSLLVALDGKTGKRVWAGKRGLSRIAHVSPLLIEDSGRRLILSNAGDRIQTFDPKTGELIWSAYSQGEGVTPSPVFGDGLIFTSSGFEKTTLRTIKPGGSGDVTATHVAWEQRKGAPTQPSLLYVNSLLHSITDGGVAHCYRGASGELVYAERVGGNHSASPVHADGRIYFLSEEGVCTVIKAGEKFEKLAENKLPGRFQASPAVSGGRIFLRSDKELFCVK